MRIISGKNRGLKLSVIGVGDLKNHLRPTSDRVKEALFNLLANGSLKLSFENLRVLDLFAGSGALGLEALSRGASWVTFFDKNKVAIELLKKNISICKVNGSTEIKQRDVTKLGRNMGKKFDLIFLDPPYGSELGDYALLNVLKEGWVSENAIVVFEYDKRILLKDFTLLDCRKYGKTFVNVLKYN